MSRSSKLSSTGLSTMPVICRLHWRGSIARHGQRDVDAVEVLVGRVEAGCHQWRMARVGGRGQGDRVAGLVGGLGAAAPDDRGEPARERGAQRDQPGRDEERAPPGAAWCGRRLVRAAVWPTLAQSGVRSCLRLGSSRVPGTGAGVRHGRLSGRARRAARRRPRLRRAGRAGRRAGGRRGGSVRRPRRPGRVRRWRAGRRCGGGRRARRPRRPGPRARAGWCR